MHEGDDDHIHLDDDAIAFTGERIELASVGVDVGTSTSHLIFSRLTLERQGRRLSSRYAVTGREIIHRSPVVFTPYALSGEIDAPALEVFITRTYEEAGITRDQVDAGALITTGEAARRQNARAVGDLFAREAGKFVAAAAGPNLESLLAAHGSGAVDLSRTGGDPLLSIDIGGGTTKFAVCMRGQVEETGAIHLGARLLAWDEDGRVSRLEDAGRRMATAAGLTRLRLNESVSSEDRDRVAEYMAEIVLGIVAGVRESDFWITPPLRPAPSFRRVVFSGGVAEYVYGREQRDFGDLGSRLARALRRQAAARDLVVLEPREAIRATCIGASQYTVQLSGDTIFLSDTAVLPLRSIPVVGLHFHEGTAPAVAEAVRRGLARLDLNGGTDGDGRFALALHWPHGADYGSLQELCAGIVTALPGVRDDRPLLAVVDADVAGLVGALLQREFGVRGAIVCIDQVSLQEFDYIDIGRPLPDQGVVPVVVKSLVFC